MIEKKKKIVEIKINTMVDAGCDEHLGRKSWIVHEKLCIVINGVNPVLLETD